jgi:hypothetical protein
MAFRCRPLSRRPHCLPPVGTRPPFSCFSYLHVSPRPPFPLPLLPVAPLKKGVARRHRASVLFPSSVLPSKHPMSNPPPPVAFLTTPSIRAPPLTENLAVPLTPSPLRGESCHHAPSSPLLQLGSPLTSPSLSQSRRRASGQCWPPSGLTPLPTAVVVKSLHHPTVAPPPR